MKNKKMRMAMGLALMFLLAGSLPSAPEAAPKTMVLGTGPAGTASFPYQVGIATIVNKAFPNEFALSPQETGGSVANIRLVAAGTIHLTGFSGMVAAEALDGKPPFKEKYDIRALFSMYGQRFFWMARKASGVTSWKQIPGKKIVVGTPGGSTRVVGDLTANALGMKGKAQILYLAPTAMIDNLRDGRIDAGNGFIAGGSLAPFVQEIVSSMEVVPFAMDRAVAEKLAKDKHGLAVAEIPADFIFKGSPALTTVSEYLITGVSPKMDERTAYLITKTIQENLPEMAKYSPAVKGIKPEDALKGFPPNLALHPGAARYYKEKGLIK